MSMAAKAETRARSARTDEILAKNSQFIPGGMASVNRRTDPPIAFARASARIFGMSTAINTSTTTPASRRTSSATMIRT